MEAPPKGVLLLGVQGGGKSLAAKSVAGFWQAPLLRLDLSALYNKFSGETRRNLRDSLATASAMASCVLWLDKIAGDRRCAIRGARDRERARHGEPRGRVARPTAPVRHAREGDRGAVMLGDASDRFGRWISVDSCRMPRIVRRQYNRTAPSKYQVRRISITS